MARKKVAKFCPRGHEMQMTWATCPRCTDSTSSVAAPRDMTEQTVYDGQDVSSPDATVIVQSAASKASPPPIPVQKTGHLSARLVGSGGPAQGTDVELSVGIYRIGKSPGESQGFRVLTLEGDGYVSKHHATLTVGTAQLVLVDAGSTNGTRVNGEVISRAILKSGDTLRFGESQFRLEMKQV